MIRCLAVLLLVAVATGSHLTDPVFDEEWVDFKNFYNKIYENEHEELVRRLIWERNVQYIDKHNLKANLGYFTYILGVNEYTDMTNTEFVKLMNGFLNLNLTRSPNSFTSTDISDLPAEVDWRTKGYVTPVKNQSCGQMERVYSLIQDEQLVPVRFSYATVSPLINRQEFLRKGQCGSCWAFSTTGSLEGQHFKATGRLVSLSEQNLVDCSTAEGNLGCSGGLMDNAFTYIKKNHGVDTEASYPYKAKNGRCHFKKGHIGATDTGYTDIQKGSEFALQKAVATVGPISVAIDASHPSFQLYRSGVYVEDECSTVLLDHGVLAVGYGTSDGQDYWLVKNSWGATWGKDGYIMMARNHNNMCGIATSASYPNV